jgi:hypothetical protein
MPLDTPYEIHALVKKKWKLLACLSSSQAAIDDAIELQQNEKYAAVRVMARAMDQEDDDSSRLIYQFTRAARMVDPGGADARFERTDARPHVSRLWKYCIAVALLLLLGFEGCA